VSKFKDVALPKAMGYVPTAQVGITSEMEPAYPVILAA
jgi:hypothetical protein